MFDTSDSNLKVGLQLVGKSTLTLREWTGKFAEQQHQHQYPQDTNDRKTKFGAALVKNFEKFNLNKQTCTLCLAQKSKSQFSRMCACSHTYCYSCLNSYAISRIQDSTPVVCPNQKCGQVMPISSKIYRFLPDSVKIKYLQNSEVFRIRKNPFLKKEDADFMCPRCLLQKHPGDCCYTLSAENIQKSYKYRECPYCHVEINMTEGKRKVKCSMCSKYSCYLCGQGLAESSTHDCSQREQVKLLQKQQESGCCTCWSCSVGCCECGQCNCCSCDCCVECNSDFCCQLLFYFGGDCSLFCILWNLLSIPIRIALSSIILGAMLGLGTILVVFTCTIWFIVCLLGAICPIPIEIICNDDTPCIARLIMVLFYPITILVCFGMTIKESRETPCSVFQGFFGMYCSLLGGIWVGLSPYECLR